MSGRIRCRPDRADKIQARKQQDFFEPQCQAKEGDPSQQTGKRLGESLKSGKTCYSYDDNSKPDVAGYTIEQWRGAMANSTILGAKTQIVPTLCAIEKPESHLVSRMSVELKRKSLNTRGFSHLCEGKSSPKRKLRMVVTRGNPEWFDWLSHARQAGLRTSFSADSAVTPMSFRR